MEQLDELDVLDNQTGVSRCVVPLHTPGIGPMFLKRCEPYTCSVVDNIRHTTGQVWFSLAWVISFHVDKYPVAVMHRVLCSVQVWSYTVHLELQECVKSSYWPGISQCQWYVVDVGCNKFFKVLQCMFPMSGSE